MSAGCSFSVGAPAGADTPDVLDVTGADVLEPVGSTLDSEVGRVLRVEGSAVLDSRLTVEVNLEVDAVVCVLGEDVVWVEAGAADFVTVERAALPVPFVRVGAARFPVPVGRISVATITS